MFLMLGASAPPDSAAPAARRTLTTASGTDARYF